MSLLLEQEMNRKTPQHQYPLLRRTNMDIRGNNQRDNRRDMDMDTGHTSKGLGVKHRQSI